MKFLVPEVVQTSMMDCGVACLKSLLDGFGIPADLGRLREACQTSVDGTSIDTLEEVANQLGLEAEQRMIPVNHLLDPRGGCLPGMVVVQKADGLTHFVVVWNRVGPYLQVMDPGTGRRWIPIHRFEKELYIHLTDVPADGWRGWFGGGQPLAVLRAQLEALGAPLDLVEKALLDPEWKGLAGLDAVARLTQSLLRSGAVQKGPQLGALVAALVQEAGTPDSPVPSEMWSVAEKEPGTLQLRGAVVLSVLGRRKEAVDPSQLPRELAAALTTPPPKAGRILWSLLAADDHSLGEERLDRLPSGFRPLLPLGMLALVTVAASLGAILEALLLRALLSLDTLLALPLYRLAAATGFGAFLLLLLFADLAGTMGTQWLGRRLETRLRIAFLARIPRLGDRYFHSRLITDLAERSHGLYYLRQVPSWLRGLLASLAGLAATAMGILYLDPWSFPILGLSVLGMIAVPAALNGPLTERDLRTRDHVGALGRFYLDALLGAIPIRAHGAERNIRHAQESRLSEWGRATREQLSLAVAGEAGTSLVALASVVSLVGLHLMEEGAGGEVLLLLWWALRLPFHASNLVLQFRQYPATRNILLRLLEPLGTPVEGELPPAVEEESGVQGPVSITLENLGAIAGGHRVLEGLNLQIQPGEHIAIVGRSGSGKSSLLNLLLGWMVPSSGTLQVDGEPLSGTALYRLRRRTAWVDPEVRLWNRSLLSNLRYGSDGENLPLVLDQAELQEVLERLPEGLHTSLGEGGSRLSGGQGQRVRLGRAMLRSDVDLVLLDEPFRGLDRPARERLLQVSRQLWSQQTLLCVTHDVQETRHFPRVLVMENGTICEDGSPEELLASDSRYAQLLAAEKRVQEQLWGRFTRLRLEQGRLEAP